MELQKKRELADISGGWSYEMQTLGFNYRLADIQCALGLTQLKRAEKNLKKENQLQTTTREN